MKRLLLCAAAIALALLVLRLVLAPSGAASDSGDYLRPVVAPELRETLRVATVSFSGPGEGPEHLYVQQDGVWRCESAFGAVALTVELEALVGELTGAQGEAVAGAERASAYGFGPDEVLRVRLHGPGRGPGGERDLLLEFELGHSLAGLGDGRGYLRVAGESEVLEIDHDPRARFAVDEQKRLPPLLDERLLAGEWPRRGEGIERAFIDFSSGRSIEIKSRVSGLPPAPGLPAPREWIAIEGAAQARCLPYRIGAWQAFLYRVPYRGLSDPGAAQHRGLDTPVGTVTLIQVQGEPIELVAGRSAASGASFVLNKKTGMLCLLDQSEVELLLATVDMLCSTELANPWEEWLPK